MERLRPAAAAVIPKEEHKKLVSAVNIQSRYFKTLSELVPEPLLRSAIIKQITSMSVLPVSTRTT
ncbi:hypothetical protein GQ600_2945 [Phytophthora cactorum]|nr:hypothetical protein GQ600_2945 [Phytophthora cactorum]